MSSQKSSLQKPHPPVIRLEQFLKLANVVSTGGQAKILIQGGEVKLNGVTETRRKKQLSPGDVIEVQGLVLEVGLE